MVSPTSTRFSKTSTETASSKTKLSKAPTQLAIPSSRPVSLQKTTVSTRKLETNYAALNRTLDVVTEQEVIVDQQNSRLFDSVTPFYTPTTDDLYLVPLYLKVPEELSHREKVVLEILTTEQTYVSGLEILVRVSIFFFVCCDFKSIFIIEQILLRNTITDIA